MSITDSFAGVAVADFGAMRDWYERLFGREPDLAPHDREACWQLAEGCWVYLVEDGERVGGALLTLLVEDLEAELAGISERGIEAAPTETMPGKALKATITDPEGNQVSFGQPL